MNETVLKPGWLCPEMPQEHICWRDAAEPCFQIYGLHMPSIIDRGDSPAVYERVTQEVALQCDSQEMKTLAKHTAGARVRFKTNSNYVAIRVYWEGIFEVPHQPASGKCGFDLYLTQDGMSRYYKSFMPPRCVDRMQDGYQSVVKFESEKMRDITICFPISNSVERLEIGLEEDALVTHAEPYRLEKPIVFYGPSIANGGCASKPGNTYPGFVSRALNLDHRNLGFSDSARGDLCIAEYIATLDMCAFIYDYDENAPTVEWLQRTHYPFYEVVRKAHPKVPIICMSRSMPMREDIAEFCKRDEESLMRKEVIKNTIKIAKENGDNHIYFIDGETLFAGPFSDCCTVDGLHPNDLGFYRMAQGLIPVLKEALEMEENNYEE